MHEQVLTLINMVAYHVKSNTIFLDGWIYLRVHSENVGNWEETKSFFPSLSVGHDIHGKLNKNRKKKKRLFFFYFRPDSFRNLVW